MWEKIEQFLVKNKMAFGLILLIMIIVNTFQYEYNKKHTEDTKVEEKEDNNIKEESTSTPVIYKVTKDGVDNTMYLFGSIHVADERAYPLPEIVMNAYNSSDSLAVEFDLISYSKDFNAQMASMEILLLKDGTKVNDHLSEETYNLMVDYLKENDMYNSMYDYYKPAIHYSLISSLQTELSELDSNKGIDMYFLEKAHKDNKEILEVESADLQYNLLGSMPDELYEVLIKSSVLYADQMVKDVNDLYEVWLSGDVDAILSFMQEEDDTLKDFEDIENVEMLINNYNKALITDRNITMTNKAIEYFESGKNVFFVVGLAHIIGEDAIARNLENVGYIVEQLNYE